jgi:Transposase
VKNAFIFAWSNGQVEGQINKLKTIKRQMYGRASFELLRKRMILSASLTTKIDEEPASSEWVANINHINRNIHIFYFT